MQLTLPLGFVMKRTIQSPCSFLSEETSVGMIMWAPAGTHTEGLEKQTDQRDAEGWGIFSTHFMGF